jgi:hypothetical protein
MSMSKEAEFFDKSGKYRRRADYVLRSLERFKQVYPLRGNPETIDNLKAEDIFNEGRDYFFRWIVYELKDFGYVGGYPTAFRNAAKNLNLFKEFLRTAVADEKKLAEKVDAPWENIKGMGGDKILAKKIICCYDDHVLPIFRTADLEYFFKRLTNSSRPSSYSGMSLGEKYQFLNEELLKVKEDCAETKEWDRVFFMWFLYVTYKGLS